MTGTETVWYRIEAYSNHHHYTFASGLMGDDAEALVNLFGGEYKDGNGFVWDLVIEIEEVC